MTTDTDHICKKCGKALTLDEIAITKKLVNRGASAFFCTVCLADAFDVTTEDIQAKIRYFKEIGCTLFLPFPSIL